MAFIKEEGGCEHFGWSRRVKERRRWRLVGFARATLLVSTAIMRMQVLVYWWPAWHGGEFLMRGSLVQALIVDDIIDTDNQALLVSNVTFLV